MTGVALMMGYGLLGAGWLIIKTEGDLQAWARRIGRWRLVGVCVAIMIVSLWTSSIDPAIAARWFSWQKMLFLAPVPLAYAATALACWRALGGRGPDVIPFLYAISLFLTAYLGVAISLWPKIVPHRYSFWQATSDSSTQAFLLISTLVLLPVIVTHTMWPYWVFCGKLRAEVGLH